jgi:hypothetical protein
MNILAVVAYIIRAHVFGIREEPTTRYGNDKAFFMDMHAQYQELEPQMLKQVILYMRWLLFCQNVSHAVRAARAWLADLPVRYVRRKVPK